MDQKNLMDHRQVLEALARALRARGAELGRLEVVAGFDAFVDELISVVGERRGSAEFTPIRDIAAFGKIILASAGHSSLREIVVHRQDAGGCTVNLLDGLAALGLSCSAFATLGEPPLACFASFAARCREVHGWGLEPGRTLCFEFADGKLMFSAISQLAAFNPESLRACLADGSYLAACRRAQLVALTNWTLFPHMTACWKLLQQEVYSRLDHRPWFFLDLVDPTGRSEADLRALIETLPGFAAAGPTVLGLNLQEASVFCRLFGLPAPQQTEAALLETAVALRARLELGQVVLHTARFAAVAEPTRASLAASFHCANPMKSTGAGDRFNAGFCLGLLLDLPSEERLLIGSAVAGCFVRAARSPSLSELASFLEEQARA